MNRGRNCLALDAALRDNADKPYSYVVLDYAQDQNDKMRIRNSFFPEEMIVYEKRD